MKAPAIQTPWGGSARVRLHPRQNPQLAAARTPRYEEPSHRLVLQAERLLDEMRLAEDLRSNDAQRMQLALNAYNDRMQRYGDLVTGRASLSSSGTFPDQQTQGIPTAVMLGDAERQRIDTRWTTLFNVQDRRGSTTPYFEISDVYHNVTVDEYLEGERVRIGHVSAEEAIYKAKIYGVGLQWNQFWSQWQDLWSVADGMTSMQVRWANKQASLAYAAITGSGLATTAYDTAGANATEKDINTINAAAVAIRSSLYNAASTSGQAVEEIVGPDATYYLLYNDLTAGYPERISRALEARFLIALQGGTTAMAGLSYPVVPVPSPYVATGNWFLTLPSRKNVFALFRDLRFYNILDPRIAGVAEGEIGWGAYRFVVDDINQMRKLALS